jgi:integrase
MSRPKKLTAAAVVGFKADPKRRRRIPDPATPSLFLIIEPSGRKSWGMRFRVGAGRIGKMKLGDVDVSGKEMQAEPVIGQPLTLAAARLLAAQVHRERALGHDPVGEHKARKLRKRTEVEEREASTFAAAAQTYVEEYAKPEIRRWREISKVLGFDYQDGSDPAIRTRGLAERWADKTVGEIDAALVRTVIDEARRVAIPGIPAKTKGRSEARARSVCAALSGMWGWLREQRDRYPTVGNPFADVTRPKPTGERDRELDPAEIRWFWHACASADGPRIPGAPKPFAPLLRLLLLTGARLSEVAGMRRDELHEDGSWHLPGSRSKNHDAHIVPLAPLARAQLDTMQGRGDLIFTTNGERPVSGFSRMKARLDEAMLALAQAERGDATVPAWTLHDLRRTFSTRLPEDLSIPPNVVDKALNHKLGGIAGRYNKSQLLNERRTALAAWARYVELIIDKDLYAAHLRLIADNDERRELFRSAVLKGNDTWSHYLAMLTAGNVIPMRPREASTEIAS